MNRRFLRTIAVLAVIALAIFISSVWRHRNSQAPRFVAGTPASIPPSKNEQFDFLADAPFENDRLWIWSDIISPDRHLYLYDLRQKKILGQLSNCETPDLSSSDGSRLLVRGIESPDSFMQSMLGPVLKIFNIRLQSQRTETFWLVDTSRNSAQRLGSLSQFSGAGSRWHPSPDFRYGYTVPTTSMGTALYLCDLEQPSLARIALSGYPCGWWDDHDILIDTGKHQFDLLDIRTQTTRSLFVAADFEKLSTDSNSPPDLAAVPNWNGRSFDFYFGYRDQISGLKGTNSIVYRASADSPQLTLLYPEFQFHWSGHFDPTGKHYLYPGENGQPGRGGDSSVYLRDLTSGTVSTIVPPESRGHYSIPRFYGNEVIYIHDWRVHRIGLDGSNDAFVLPPGK